MVQEPKLLLPHRTDHRGYVLLGWRVHPKMTALDAFGCKNLSWVKLTENAKKIRKSLAVCENMYNFAAVFQISVN